MEDRVTVRDLISAVAEIYVKKVTGGEGGAE